MNAKMMIKSVTGWSLALILVLLALGWQPKAISLASITAGPYYVDRSDDATVTACTSALNDCTLRGAINNANSSTDTTIYFDSSVTHIDLVDQLMVSGDRTTIDGYGVIPVIDGTNLNSSNYVFSIIADDITIANLSIINGPQYGADIFVFDALAAHIWGNYLGILPSSTTCLSGGVIRNSDDGIIVYHDEKGYDGPNHGSAYIYSNIIGCHPRDGIYILGSDYVYVGIGPYGSVSGNLIGVSPNGEDLGNGENGVRLFNFGTTPSIHNQIGNNTISGNGHSGVNIDSGDENYVWGNNIGMNPAGTMGVPNGWDGVRIEGYTGVDQAYANNIGGTTEAERNVISGNHQSGVMIMNNANFNSVRGNTIGMNLARTIRIPNGHAGIAVKYDCSTNTIGSPSLTSTNQFVAGNQREGIYIEHANDTYIYQSNLIYTNGLQGIVVNTGGYTATGNYLKAFEVYGNGGLPIDLGGDGHTENGSRSEPPPGPNGWEQYPVITNIIGRFIEGVACSECEVYFYLAMGNPAAPGGGGSYRGSTTTNGVGFWSKDLDTLVGGSSLTVASLTMVACDSMANCSEMRPRPVVYLPLVRR